MLARVADSIYWMSRYVERAENVARFIEVNLNLMLDLPVGSAQQWQPLVDTTGDATAFAKRYGAATQRNVIQFLTFDLENVNSICYSLRAARENARSVREIISSEMWEQLNEFYLMVNSSAVGSRTDPQDLFASVRMAGHLFTGVTDATMTHNESWNFCRLGRMLERADKTSRILDVKYFLLLPTAADVGTTSDDIQWAAVLRSASAFEMYRKSHGRISPDRIVEFLLLEREFPRAINYCLVRARESVHAISGTPVDMVRHPVERLLGELCSELAYARVETIITTGLHEYLDRLQTRLNQVGNGVSETFFAARGTPPVRKKAKARAAAVQSVV
ncbi:MAG TPA: alpha-E domain-containing protein [Vicinamibacterales bacterium]|nr:alpha-E domain-containing protein [Vicinamibacterales bacterium]